MFDIVTAHDFLAKLKADFDDFMKEPQSARLALNCIITAYHLHEWVWGDLLRKDYETWRRLGLTGKPTREAWLAWIDKACVWFSFIQDLANGSKHFIRDQGFKTERVTGYGSGPYGVGPYGAGYLLIDYGDGAGEHRYQTAAALIEVVVRFWRDFFALYYPQPASEAAQT